MSEFPCRVRPFLRIPRRSFGPMRPAKMRSVDAPAGPEGASGDLLLARYSGLSDQPMPIGEELAGYQQGVFGGSRQRAAWGINPSVYSSSNTL
jgi:hypothetical protein